MAAQTVAGSEGVEAAALALLAAFRAGDITSEDLLGPLSGTREVNSKAGQRPQSSSTPSTPVPALATAPHAPFSPLDEHNTKLVSQVGPTGRPNPTPKGRYDLVVLGAGVAGLLSVIIGKALGKRCALIEQHYMGGDCLNIGCFPSKALLASARRIHEIRTAGALGIDVGGHVTVDFGRVMERVRRLRADISPNDSVERYGRDFCEDVFLGRARFTDRHTVELDDGTTLKFDKAMVATGASAAVPPIPGLAETEHLTNNNFFNLTDLPATLICIGAGPIGMELAQAMQRFGCSVTVLEAGPQFLPREDPDAAAVLQSALEQDGVALHLGVKVARVEGSAEGNVTHAPFRRYSVTVCMTDGEQRVFEAEAVLNATGRVPNVTGIGLEAAGVEFDVRAGVCVSDHFQTSNTDVYACGDVASPFKFTHAADWSARVAIRNMFLGETQSSARLVVPWCTYTEPEIAHVGLYEAELKERGIPHETLLRPLEHVDRFICDGVKEGFCKIHIAADSDQILGATIVAPSAGSMISELSTCIQYNIGATKLAGVMHPYPTQQEAVRQCAAQANKRFKTPANARALELIMAGQTTEAAPATARP